MRRLGSFILGLGLLALLAGLIINFLIVPRAKQFPADVDETRTFDGVLNTTLNPEALATGDLASLFVTDIPVTVERRLQVLETDGSKALVQSDALVLDPANQPIQATESVYAIDRKTMLSIENFTDNPNVIASEGLAAGFPIGTEKRDYVGWNGESGETNPLRFEGEEEREGVDVYHFTSASGPDAILEPDPASLPPALPKAQLLGLVGVLGLPEATTSQLAGALELAPDPVPLSYTYSYTRDFYIDPATGILIDYNTNETRTAGVNIAGNFQPLATVWDLTFEQSDQGIADSKADADEAQGQLFWLATILPWALMIGGALLALFGLWTRFKHRDRGIDPDLEPQSFMGSDGSAVLDGGRQRIDDINDLG